MTRFGTGPGLALLLHCSLAHGGVWRKVAAPFEQDLTCLAPDMPGHGKAAPWDEQGDIHDVVTAQARSLLERPAHLVGHSFGATVALRLALEQPDKVLSLTLVEPVLFAAARGQAEFDAYMGESQDFLAAQEAQDWPSMARGFFSAWGGGMAWEDLPPKARETNTALMPLIAGSNPSLIDDCHGLLAGDGLEQLRMPVTFLRGGQTQPIVAAIHRSLMARIPQAREIVVPQAGHMLAITHPDAVSEVLRENLAVGVS